MAYDFAPNVMERYGLQSQTRTFVLGLHNEDYQLQSLYRIHYYKDSNYCLLRCEAV
jgi:hypothetical protein